MKTISIKKTAYHYIKHMSDKDLGVLFRAVFLYAENPDCEISDSNKALIKTMLNGYKTPFQKDSHAPSSEGLGFADWFAREYPTKKEPTIAQKTNWAAMYDKLLRIDGYTKQEVIKVVKWAKNDSFWCKQFYTPMKLREKKGEISYMERFLNEANSAKPKEEPLVHKTSGKYNAVTGQYE